MMQHIFVQTSAPSTYTELCDRTAARLPGGTIALVMRDQPVKIGNRILHPGGVLLFDCPQKLEEIDTRGPVLTIVVHVLA